MNSGIIVIHAVMMKTGEVVGWTPWVNGGYSSTVLNPIKRTNKQILGNCGIHNCKNVSSRAWAPVFGGWQRARAAPHPAAHELHCLTPPPRPGIPPALSLAGVLRRPGDLRQPRHLPPGRPQQGRAGVRERGRAGGGLGAAGRAHPPYTSQLP